MTTIENATFVFHSATRAERYAAGKALRSKAPRISHGEWAPASDRPDPISVLEEQNRTRLPELVPIRMGRMSLSPFAFLRGSAAVMANDLAKTPVWASGYSSAAMHTQVTSAASLRQSAIWSST